jgi:O-antigen ligase
MSDLFSGRGPLIRDLLGLGLAVVLALAAVMTRSMAGSQDARLLPDAPLAADKSLGVNVDLTRLDTPAREEALAAMEAAGLRWVRQRFPWNAIEPQHGVFHWAPWDEIVEAVDAHGLQLIAVLDGSPAWAQAPEDVGSTTENPLAPPQETCDFGDWAAALAERYATRIDHYQIWDEPNIAPHWGAREIDPGGYARLLREGSIRIRAVDPGAVILAAALAPNVEPGGANLSDVDFLRALYQQGAAEWFDVVAVQPYDFGQPLDAPADAGQLNWQRPALLRQVMVAYADEETAIWAVSSGLAATSGSALRETVPTVVGQARRDWPWLGPILWAAWSPDDAHGDYALVDASGQPLAGYEALRALARTPSVAWPGTYPADHPSGRYTGQWRVTPLGADVGASGDRLAIRFQGSRLDLTVRRGDYRAFLFVTVDGQPANALPQDGQGRAFVVLYDPLHGTEAVTLARGLPPGEHVAEIVAERGWGQWAIGGWRVTWQDTALPALLPALLALAAVGALLLPLAQAWAQRRQLLEGLDRLLARIRILDQRLILILAAVLALGFYAMPGMLPSLVALALLAFVLFLRPQSGLALVAISLPFYQVGKPLMGWVFSMTEILVVVTAAAWLLRSLLAGRQSRWTDGLRSWPATIQPADWAVLALVVVAALSLLWTEEGRVAAREFRTVVLESALFYGLLRAMVREPRHAWPIVDAWLLGAVLIALVGVGQWVLGRGLITAEGVWRVRGFYGSPNNLALYLGRLLPLALAFLAWGRHRRRWAYGLAAVVLAAALFLTYSRGAWVVGVPASLLFLAAMRGRRTFALAVGLLLVVAVLLVLLVGPGRLISLLDSSQGTTFFRLQLWQSSLAMICDHPLLGVGLDNFLYQYRSHYVLPTAWEEFNLSHPHNLVLDFWLRLGLAGLATILWLLAVFFRRGWSLYRNVPESNERLLILGLMAGMVNFVAHGLVDNAFFLVDLSFAFMLMLSLINIEYPISNTRQGGREQ